VYKSINVENLFNQIVEMLMKQGDEMGDSDQDSIIIGYFKLLGKIIEVNDDIKNKPSSVELIKHIFNTCLWNPESKPGDTKLLKCNSNLTRQWAYNFLQEMVKNNQKNFKALLQYGFNPLVNNLPEVTSWSYNPVGDNKSSHGLCGINNLSNICYMIAMLQQFYMTPAFRYAILSAEDYQEDNIEEFDNRKFDDNLFHQLQRMFAFMDISQRKDYKPTFFCRAFDWEGQPVNIREQQDSSDFLAKIFDKIERAMKPTPFKTILDSIYQGKTCNVKICKNCGYERFSTETFYNYTLEVKQ